MFKSVIKEKLDKGELAEIYIDSFHESEAFYCIYTDEIQKKTGGAFYGILYFQRNRGVTGYIRGRVCFSFINTSLFRRGQLWTIMIRKRGKAGELSGRCNLFSDIHRTISPRAIFACVAFTLLSVYHFPEDTGYTVYVRGNIREDCLAVFGEAKLIISSVPSLESSSYRELPQKA